MMAAIPQETARRFADFGDLQHFLAQELGGEPFDYARDKPETIQLAIDLGVGDEARRVIDLSREMGPAIEATVERAKRADLAVVEPLRPRARERATALPHVWLEQAALPRQDTALVKSLIGHRDLVMVYGEPSCGKTFLVVDLAGHVAAGMPWRGLRVKGGLVAYIAAEAGRSILRRFIAWRDHHVGEARESRVPLLVIPAGVNLLNAVDVEELIAQLREIAAAAGCALSLVVFDTLSRSMPGGDENTAADMTRVIAAADRIRDELATACLVVHHSGKDRTKGARGHSALAAAADAVISVADHVATVEKVRDGVAGQRFPFALDVVELGADQDGDPITTCLVRPEDREEAEGDVCAAGLGKNQELALNVLRALYARARKNLDERGDDPDGAHILLGGWRTALQDKGMDRKRYNEVAGRLKERGLVRVEGVHVFLTGDAP